MSTDRLSSQTAEVDQFLQSLDHSMKAEIGNLREAILASNARITERIKWKAPSFCYNGDDRVTFRLPPKGGLQLIFHRGVKVKDASGFVFEDGSGLMQWAAADRAIVTLGARDEVLTHRAAIVALVNQWMESTT